jgi:hypothetical protein
MFRALKTNILLCTLLVPLFAQTPDTATLRGEVHDTTQGAVEGVEIQIKNAQTGLERHAVTNHAGEFSFMGLPIAGSYEVSATKQRFAEAHSEPIRLAGGTTAAVTLQLDAAPAKTEINVIGFAGGTRTDQPQLGEQFVAGQIDEMPLLNRKVSFLPLLSSANRPAINQGDVFMNQNLFTTNGAGRRQTWFEIDGSTGNDSWGRQTAFTNLPLAAIQEITILQNAFSAEYGGSTGSVVNIVTKTGGNEFHGEALGIFRPAATAAALSGFTTQNAASGNDFTSDTLMQPALTVSGPLGHNGRTHFLATGEYSIEDRASPIISPVAPGIFVGQYRGWLGLLRIDHQLNDRNNLFLRSSVDGYRDTNPNGTVGGNSLPTVDRIFKRRTYSEELGETAVISPRLINNFRVQFQLGSPITEFDPVVYGTQYSVPISTGGTFTSGTSQSALLLNRQYQATDTISAVFGKHQFKVGADVIVAHNGGNSKEFGGPIYLGQFVYNTCTLALSVCESSAFLNNIANVKTYTQSYGNANYTVNDTLWSLFAQDDYRATARLTLNAGLRYERQTLTDSNKGFAPRVGFAFDVNGNGHTVLRGGFGIYYSQIVDNSVANYALTGPTGVFNYTASAGQIGFPTSVTSVPLPVFPAGATAPLRSLYIRPGNSAFLNQFFPTSALVGYPNQLSNPYSEQWTFGIQQQLGRNWVLDMDYIGSHTLRINRPLDVDAPAPFIRTAPNQIRTAQAANCTRPYWIAWYAQQGLACNAQKATSPQPPYSVIQSDVNDGYSYYDALNVNLRRRFGQHMTALASYTWSHAIDNVDPDIPGQNPNDANFPGKTENASAIFDQRQRLVLSGFYTGPLKITFGGIATFGSGLPYNYVTGTTNSGDTGATTDRPVINGVVVGRNAGRGNAIYDFSPFVERAFPFRTDRVHINLRAEAFNVFNHANFVGYSGTYGNGAASGAGFGQPLVGITNQLPARSLQFEARLAF